MEQLKRLNDLFQLKKLPDLALANSATIYNSELLLLTMGILCLVNLLGFLHPFTILLLGFVLPFWCMLEGYSIRDYFPFLSGLLWIRLFYSPLQSLDVRVKL